MGLGWRARSAGLSQALNESVNLGPIAAQTLQALKQRSIPIGEPIRYPRGATLEDFASADLVVALREAEHRTMMRQRFPKWEDRIIYWHVADLNQAPADSALAEIETLVLALLATLNSRDTHSSVESPTA
jgi:protein-tyrosine phosphatase